MKRIAATSSRAAEDTRNGISWAIVSKFSGGCEIITMDGVTHMIPERWDMIIAHPPCTYLTLAGNKWFKPEFADRFPERQKQRKEAVDFFMAIANADCDKIAIENPVGVMSSQWRKPDQYIEPYMFGDPEKKKMFEQGTHFNPVDLVCAIKNYKGEKFDLPQYVDKATGFISHKSKDGKELKALELPGLWNGAMSDWSTVFVEVPLSTFNPVKTVNDLYREQHQ